MRSPLMIKFLLLSAILFLLPQWSAEASPYQPYGYSRAYQAPRPRSVSQYARRPQALPYVSMARYYQTPYYWYHTTSGYPPSIGPFTPFKLPQFDGICGNGRVDPGEQCDDGNILNGDGCSLSCLREEPLYQCPRGQQFFDGCNWCTCTSQGYACTAKLCY